MATSTLFPLKPASRLVSADTAWPTAVELHCGDCGYGVCPMCGATGAWHAPAERYRSAPSIRRAR